MSQDTEREALLPCPFCGAGETQIHVQNGVWNGRGFGDPISVSVRHWCGPVQGQPSRMIERIGRDHESAIAAWNTRAALASQPPAVQGEPVEWGSTKTAGQLIRQLQTFDPATPITAACHADYEGKRMALARPLVMSRERVAGRFIRQGDESVPYSLVIWSQQDEAASPPSREPQWQPIETAPKDGTLIVLGARNGVWLGKYLPVYQSGYRPDNPWSSMMLNHDHMAERRTRPTHWMPLPPPPGIHSREGGSK